MNTNIQSDDVAAWGSIAKNKEIRSAFYERILADDPDYFVTFAFNRNTSLNGGKRKLRQWHYQINRALYGKRWLKKGLDEQVFFWAFPEHLKSNLHYHAMLTVGDPTKRDDFEQNAVVIWDKLVPSGSIKMTFAETATDTIRETYYSTKDLWTRECTEDFVFSTEFV